ncbi:hypothetical protein ACFQH2_08800 [Natronoarchaeum sp. GCM10025703]|uniref:hypothetical protein n=1 Tax=Natronoarchaeum sp. GCM10025703 TaxID=3252685 RepID=UPI0036156C52
MSEHVSDGGPERRSVALDERCHRVAEAELAFYESVLYLVPARRIDVFPEGV